MDSFVTLSPDQTGKKVESEENTISGQDVHAQVVTVIDGTGLTNSFVQVADVPGGTKIHYFENTIDGQQVHAIALVPVDVNGTPIQ